jgi:hypothetical protein
VSARPSSLHVVSVVRDLIRRFFDFRFASQDLDGPKLIDDLAAPSNTDRTEATGDFGA